jgi:hypothetical protein
MSLQRTSTTTLGACMEEKINLRGGTNLKAVY